jgi:hypothetical protein
MTTTSQGYRSGLVRAYDQEGRLLLATYLREDVIMARLDQQLLMDHAQRVTFTPTVDLIEAESLAAELRPVIARATAGSYLAQRGGLEYLHAVTRAATHPEHAAGAYVATCPTCGALEHAPCREDRTDLTTPHPARADQAEQVTAERDAVLDADEGFTVWTNIRSGHRV